ncbi:UNVERIFIED_CONTAM: hypothetical protein GTU68_049091 [Idotea baltica]|nr:hypothetical protein [Idotea baltica]
MTRFSANLGFLWTELDIPDAIHAAKTAGFAAVECHWPYDTPAKDVQIALDHTGLQMLGLNTRRGDVAGGENGLSALPDREEEARAAIEEAIDYANVVSAGSIHVMAGYATGAEARGVFVQNLKWAADKAKECGITLLIEPLNRHDAPGYFLETTDQAVDIIRDVSADNLKLMFDCYHVGRTEGDIITRLSKLHDLIGHIQFASVPDRGAPDHGEVNFQAVFDAIGAMGWTMPLGAEYKPGKDTNASLGWMQDLT